MAANEMATNWRRCCTSNDNDNDNDNDNNNEPSTPTTAFVLQLEECARGADEGCPATAVDAFAVVRF